MHRVWSVVGRQSRTVRDTIAVKVNAINVTIRGCYSCVFRRHWFQTAHIAGLDPIELKTGALDQRSGRAP
jgi:hypothetical protein